MKLRLDFENQEVSIQKNRCFITVVIIRSSRKNKIVYHSGRNYFFHESAQKAFIDEIKDEVPDNYRIEFHNISMVEPIAPNPSEVRVKGTWWCPYCGEYHKFKDTRDGYFRCPICNISNGDHHVKLYNNLWPNTGKKK
jgi:rubrerythrin